MIHILVDLDEALPRLIAKLDLDPTEFPTPPFVYDEMMKQGLLKLDDKWCESNQALNCTIRVFNKDDIAELNRLMT